MRIHRQRGASDDSQSLHAGKGIAGQPGPLSNAERNLTMAVRIEHDLLGEREVPEEVYYGVHTLRALENFPISRIPISTYPNLVKALACVKEACALANHELGLLEDDK